MTLSRPVRLLLSVASGLALSFSFPNYNLPLLAWISVALLMLAALGARTRDAALYGFLNGAFFYPLSVPWIATVMKQYGSNIGWFAAGGILALMSLAGALFPLVFSVLVSRVGKKSIPVACAVAPFLWVVLEFARANLPIIGFPWNLLGYAASGNLAFVQLTSITGVYGLSLLIAAFNASLAWTFASPSGKSRRITIGAVILLIAVALAGPRFVPQAEPEHVAHLVQTNLAQEEIYPSNWMQIHAADMQQLESLSVAAAKQSPGLIVWPEVPAPFTLQDPQFTAIANRIARDSGQDFLVGVVDWEISPGRHWLASNSAVLLNSSGQREFTYDKIHLVPFGEYVPLRKYLFFAHSLIDSIGDFTPGREYSVGALAGGRFSVFICYEAIFSSAIRRFANNGAQLLINISNDGWFGRSSAPAQHLMMARVRAVENHRWLLRCTNTGFTVDVDPYGRIVAQLPRFTRGELDAPYGFRSDLTPYTRFGDWVAWLCVLATVGFLFAGFARTKQE